MSDVKIEKETVVKPEKIKVVETTFLKEQILQADAYKDQKDLVSALLIDGVNYTFKEVDNMVNRYLKGKVN